MKKDINLVIEGLTLIVFKTLDDKSLWQIFGYNSPPKYNFIYQILLPKQFQLSAYLKEIFLVCIVIDIINSIRFSLLESKIKKILIIGILEDLSLILIKSNTEMNKKFVDILKEYDSNLNKSTDSILIDNAKNNINKENLAKFLAGIIKLKAYKSLNNKNINSRYFILNTKKT